MGKANPKVTEPSIPKKNLFSRLNYLHQAARYLERTPRHQKGSGNSRHLIDELQRVASKSQIRLAPEVKHGICQRCQSILEEGISLSSYIENGSKNGAKPWADILVRKCNRCDAERRIPVGAERQLRRKKRPAKPS